MIDLVVHLTTGEQVELEFEHCLASLSKWEGIHERTFVRRPTEEPMTREEKRTYYRCMLLSGRSFEKYLQYLSPEQELALDFYINAPMTATTVPDAPERPGGGRDHLSAELVYYLMSQLKIPYSCDQWHFNKLMILIRLSLYKQEKPKKQTKSATAMNYREINARRRAETGTSG